MRTRWIDLLDPTQDDLQAVIASLLVPTPIVGCYGQNFAPAFDEGYWSLAMSGGLILASTVAQLAVFRWRRWL